MLSFPLGFVFQVWIMGIETKQYRHKFIDANKKHDTPVLLTVGYVCLNVCCLIQLHHGGGPLSFYSHYHVGVVTADVTVEHGAVSIDKM